MDQTTTPFARYWYALLVLFLAILVGLTYANYRYAQTNPGGNDFLVHWAGTRILLTEGLSPYSDEVATRIQTLAYGRPARPGEHELRVAYPLYSGIIFTPFAMVPDFTLARALWMTFLELALILLAFFCLRVTQWGPAIWLLFFYLLFALFWYLSVRALIHGNAVIVVTLFLVGALEALRNKRDELAGILLAFSTIKPQVVILVVLFILIWALTQGRRKVLLWFLIALGLLSIGAALFVPDWPLQNLREVVRYPGYNPPGTPGATIATWLPVLGERIGWLLSGTLGVLLIIEWFMARGKDYRWFLWTACLTLVASQWIGIQTDPGNFIVLFIPLTLFFAVLEERWGRRSRLVNLALMVIVFAGLWVFFLQTVSYGDQPVQSPLMFFPLPLFLLVGLYWVRWWAIRPQRLLVEMLRDFDERA